ncbi:unnamed protein product [Haemonchus placei]|uniref:COesterase domain-containing protein n=1 Tax=Haemonchus placei TaxID=6290 RepID=A0A0N4WSQ3_HAEPC|nr:unnamed protein product [Haemonchus placei]
MYMKQGISPTLVFPVLQLLVGAMCLSEEGRMSLIKSLRGVDLELRHERLKKLKVVSLEQKASMVDAPLQIAEYGTPDDIVEPFPEGGSIVKINQNQGVDRYLYEGDINLTEYVHFVNLPSTSNSSSTNPALPHLQADWVG